MGSIDRSPAARQRMKSNIQSVQVDEEGLPIPKGMSANVQVDEEGLPIPSFKKKVDTNASKNGGIDNQEASQSNSTSPYGLPTTISPNKSFQDVFSIVDFLGHDIATNNALTLTNYNNAPKDPLTLTGFNQSQQSLAGGSIIPSHQETIDHKAREIKSNPDALKDYRVKRTTEIQSHIDDLKKQQDQYIGAEVVNPEFGITKTISTNPLITESLQKNADDAQKYQNELNKSIADAAIVSVPKSFLEKGTEFNIEDVGKKYLDVIGDPTIKDDLKALETLPSLSTKGKTETVSAGVGGQGMAVLKEDNSQEIQTASELIRNKLFKNGAATLSAYYLQNAQDIEQANTEKVAEYKDAVSKGAAKDISDPVIQQYALAVNNALHYGNEAETSEKYYPQVARQKLRQELNNKFFDLVAKRDEKAVHIGELPIMNPITSLRLAAQSVLGEMPSEDDIKQLAKETNKSEDEVRDIVNSKARGFVASSPQGVRVSGFASGISQAVDETLATSLMSLRRIFNTDNVEAKNRITQNRSDAYNMGASQNQLYDKNGKLNINPYSIANTAGRGIGQMSIFAAPTLLTGGLAEGLVAPEIIAAGTVGKNAPLAHAIVNGVEGLTTVASGYIGSYEPAYKDISAYTDNEDTRRSFSNFVALANALPELLLSPAEVAKKMGIGNVTKEAVIKSFVNDAEKIGAEATLAQRLKQAVARPLEVLTAENIEEQVTNVATNVADEVYKGQIRNAKDLSDQFWQTLISTSVNMLPMAVGAGIGGANDVSGIRKQHVYEVGLNPELAKMTSKKQLDAGFLTVPQFDRTVAMVNTMQGIVSKLPETNVHGEQLSYDDKAALAAHQYRINLNNKIKEDLVKGGGVAAQLPMIELDNNDAIQKQTEILTRPAVVMPDEVVRPTTETVITPTETGNTDTKSNAAIILPQTNNAPNIIPLNATENTSQNQEAANQQNVTSNQESPLVINQQTTLSTNESQNIIQQQANEGTASSNEPEQTTEEGGANKDVVEDSQQPKEEISDDELTDNYIKNGVKYHGTSSSEITDKILPTKETGIISEKGRKKNLDKVFYSDTEKSANIYAGRAKNSYGGEPKIYKVIPIGDITTLNANKGTEVHSSDYGIVLTPDVAFKIKAKLEERGLGVPKDIFDLAKEKPETNPTPTEKTTQATEGNELKLERHWIDTGLPVEENNLVTSNTQNNAISKQEPTSEMLRNEGVRGESGLQGVEQDNKSKEPAKESTPKEKVKVSKTKASKSLRERANKIRTEGLLPSSLKLDLPEGTQQAGFGGKSFDEAIAKAFDLVADAIDEGAKLSEAAERGFNHLRDYYKTNTKSFDERKLRVRFNKQVADSVRGGNLSGITHAATEASRLEFSLPDRVRSASMTDEEVEQEAEAQIKAGYNVDELIEKMEKTHHHPSVMETAILKRYTATLEAQIEKNPSPENLAKLLKLTDASDAIGSLQGAEFRARQGMRVREGSLAGFFNRNLIVNKGVPLTDEQIAKVTKEYTEIKAAQKAYEDKIAALEAENARMKALQAFRKTKQTTTVNKKKTHADFVKERENIVNNIKEKLKKARTGERGLSAVPVPYAAELIAIAPDVLKLTKSLVEEGITKLADVVSNIHNTLKDDIPEITEKDIHDILAGEYKKPKPTRNELNQQLFDLRTQAELVNRLQGILDGAVPKSETKRQQRSVEIESLRKQIADLQKEKSDAEAAKKKVSELEDELSRLRDRREKEDKPKKPIERRKPTSREIELADAIKSEKEKWASELKKSPEEIALAALKSRTRVAIKKLEADIAAGNFEVEKKEPLKLDEEAIELKDRLIKLRQERELGLMRQQYANRTAAKKLQDNILEVANVPRTVMSSLDYSAPLRQSVIATVAHPMVAASAGVEMFRQSVSQKRFDRWFFDLRGTPRYKLMEQSGLYVADPHDPRLSVKEEAFMNNLAEKIPLIGPLIKGSERAYVGYLNKMRVDLFNQFADAYEREGMNFANRPELYKGLAIFINNVTGRGGLGPLESASPILNTAFFSPRLIASRLNILGDFFSFGKLSNYPPEIKKQFYGDMIKFIGTGAAILALIKLAWGCDNSDGKDCFQVEIDPRSSDFGKLRYNNTRWDIWGGLQQYIRIITQIISGESKSINSGKVQDLSGKGMFGKTRGDVALSFFRGKLAPIPSMVADVFSGRTTTGEKVTLRDEAVQHLLPLLATDMKDAIQDNGVKAIFTVGIPSTFGVGVQTYLPRGYENVDVKKDVVYKFLYDKKMQLAAPNTDNIPKKEIDEFLKTRERIFKDEWEVAITSGALINEKGNPTTDANQGVEIKQINNLSYEDLAALMKAISSKAQRQAKKESGIDNEESNP